TFEFTGLIDSLTPWKVAGITFDTRQWTIIASGLAVGDLVRVQGVILNDGTRVARAIIPFVDSFADTIVFTGVVSSINPWIVDGVRLVVTQDTQLLDNITVGALVRVRAQLMGDGTWSVMRIRSLYPDFGYGCLTMSSPIIAVDSANIRVKHWHVDIKRDGRIKIHGNIKVDSVITVPICTGWDRTIVIIGDIIVIYRPIVIIIDDGGGGNQLPPGCRITKKGGIKCSGRGSKRS
ncbi:MAG: hypothetical protein GY943_27525, partial [Chloroflexi bacterium]|nr:hypothetical protein [Chloroflexota bacterium]